MVTMPSSKRTGLLAIHAKPWHGINYMPLLISLEMLPQRSVKSYFFQAWNILQLANLVHSCLRSDT